MSHVLVVDDDLAMRSVVSDALRNEGHEVESVCNGLQALTAFARHRPDALVLDIAMPVMDGITFMRLLRDQTRWGSVPVVVISGQAEPKRFGRQLGAHACLSKPLDLGTLVDCVQSASSTHQGR
jgi:two-component system nitrogen regulation response regulator GlnG